MHEQVLPVIEETATVTTQSRVAGKVTVKTTTDLEHDLASVSLSRQGVEVTRIPKDEEVDAPPVVRTEGDITIVPIVEERAVVRKQLFLVEEIHIRKSVRVENVEVPITTRHQSVSVERSSGDSNPANEQD